MSVSPPPMLQQPEKTRRRRHLIENFPSTGTKSRICATRELTVDLFSGRRTGNHWGHVSPLDGGIGENDHADSETDTATPNRQHFNSLFSSNVAHCFRKQRPHLLVGDVVLMVFKRARTSGASQHATQKGSPSETRDPCQWCT